MNFFALFNILLCVAAAPAVDTVIEATAIKPQPNSNGSGVLSIKANGIIAEMDTATTSNVVGIPVAGKTGAPVSEENSQPGLSRSTGRAAVTSACSTSPVEHTAASVKPASSQHGTTTTHLTTISAASDESHKPVAASDELAIPSVAASGGIVDEPLKKRTAVTASIAPKGTAPAGCKPSQPGIFEITIAQPKAKGTANQAEKLPMCDGGGTLILHLSDGELTDNKGRTGYIASNNQFQFDGPPQAGAIFTAGFSFCGNSSLALGPSAVFWQCLSGNFYNLYNTRQGAQCDPVTIQAIPCSLPKEEGPKPGEIHGLWKAGGPGLEHQCHATGSGKAHKTGHCHETGRCHEPGKCHATGKCGETGHPHQTGKGHGVSCGKSETTRDSATKTSTADKTFGPPDTSLLSTSEHVSSTWSFQFPVGHLPAIGAPAKSFPVEPSSIEAATSKSTTTHDEA